ncbi:PIN domain-containing protein [Rathayibacter sp. VKM Ac-2760]|uniref:PIN domain-containing protein n=1 Tax=Rathayibacter sp. VKM Ac-2760 TaxID=2609253 RepID=UPI0013163B54|nr:PIN domain-containing protein [Rathayibacter sp. VKM Ac-2760]QHC59920.1 PIN domain-containing protein [Rathayibacter sp. VKM Ac-2760]
MHFPVLLDTNVLYSASLNDFLLRLASRGAFRPLWSEDVLEELTRNLSSFLPADAVARRVGAMRTHFPEALVSGHESLIPAMTNHPKDRHILAAAVRADAAVLVTFDLDDFPAESVAEFDLEVRHPDAFLLDQLDLHPGLVLDALQDWSDSCSAPPLTRRDLLLILDRTGVPRFAETVLQWLILE